MVYRDGYGDRKARPLDGRSDSQFAIQPATRELSELELRVAGWSPEEAADQVVAIAAGKLREGAHYHSSLALQPFQSFLREYFGAYSKSSQVQIEFPDHVLVLGEQGMARALSVPRNGEAFRSKFIESFPLGPQRDEGVLHNTLADKRVTGYGTFQIVEGSYSIPDDKKLVPFEAGAKIVREALRASGEDLIIPYTAHDPDPVRAWSLLQVNPVVQPAVPGISAELRSQVIFLIPGSLIAGADFMETVMGNAGDPNRLVQDLGMDPLHWTGTRHLFVVNPELSNRLTKQDLGLPNRAEVEERYSDARDDGEKRYLQKLLDDSQCWDSPDEPYHGGKPFKMVVRMGDTSVTVIAGDYFGYLKKSVKAEGISLPANLIGAEEEHAGGTVATARVNLGHSHRHRPDKSLPNRDLSFVEDMLGDRFTPQEGYGVDRFLNSREKRVIYVPSRTKFEIDPSASGSAGTITLPDGSTISHQDHVLLPGNVYVFPDGRSLTLEKLPEMEEWSLVGSLAEGIFCHKPCTVSGGGKSEISKSLSDRITSRPFHVADFEMDIEKARALLSDKTRKEIFGSRYRDPEKNHGENSRPILSERRSLGSVIKLLTPDPEYTAEYNEWLGTIPHHVRELMFVVKNLYDPEVPSMREDPFQHFTVDIVDGRPATTLKFRRKLDHSPETVMVRELRVGFDQNGEERKFSLRPDFAAVTKLQREDDISGTITVPGEAIREFLPRGFVEHWENRIGSLPSVKIAKNCELFHFQRPDDAKERGRAAKDEQNLAEGHLIPGGNFVVNFEPQEGGSERAKARLREMLEVQEYTPPVQEMLHRHAAAGDDSFFAVWPDRARIRRNEDGTPLLSSEDKPNTPQRTSNPRYLESSVFLEDPAQFEVPDICRHLARGIPVGKPAVEPVEFVAQGQRFAGSEPYTDLATGEQKMTDPFVINGPLVYLPPVERLMSDVASLTTKSVAVDGGAGTEKALTKGMFNPMSYLYDIEASVASMLLTRQDTFVSAAGNVGMTKVDHDVSYLIPELAAKMSPQERSAEWLIENRYLEKVPNFEALVDGEHRTVDMGRCGYRITERFREHYLGRIFSRPDAVFTNEQLRPEQTHPDLVAKSVENMKTAQRRVALEFFKDGTIEAASEPVKALLHIMAYGEWKREDGTVLKEGDPELERMFTTDYFLKSPQYQARLDALQISRVEYLDKAVAHLSKALESGNGHPVPKGDERRKLEERLAEAKVELERAASEEYRKQLTGMVGIHPELAHARAKRDALAEEVA